MQHVKWFFIIIVIISLCWLCSCAQGGSDVKAEISPSDKSIIDLVSKKYEKSELLSIVEFGGSINELNAKYHIECLREKDNTYRVSYCGDESVAVLLFDNSGNRLWGNVYITQQSKSDFDELVKGQSLEEVRAIDPDGVYLFLYTGRNDTPKVSSHYTKDGYLITIEYDDTNTITSINEELI